MNHLKDEKSPYLLQHVGNPVDWFPWGKQAFRLAKEKDRPIFLSIGYSTCHWCHVMAHESFEDAEVARILNEAFISIKVDREERPDVDYVYMQACEAMTGSGGWPLTVLMTPEQKPFFAATYLPKLTRYGRLGLIDLLKEVAQKWDVERSLLEADGERLTNLLNKQDAIWPEEPNRKLVRRAVNQLSENFDSRWGGFGHAPKFPTPHNLLFLQHYAALEQDKSARQMAEKTLLSMACGGIFDQIGGGFSRYSTDEMWLIPHFEKMLYDNAMLCMAYLEAYETTQKSVYRRVTERTLEYVLSELTGPDGQFYCGQDADSDGIEGKYYLFTPEEIIELLGRERGGDFCERYGIGKGKTIDGRFVPNLIGRESKLEDQEFDGQREWLRKYRKLRATLHTDDKVLSTWSSLMISAFAQASRILDQPKYLEAARRAWEFIKKHMMTEEGRLWLRWREGQTANPGQLLDYACYAFATLDLYDATFDPCYLQQAVQSAEWIERLFADDRGGYFLYAEDAEPLIDRPKECYDGALPSGNSMTAYVQIRLSHLTKQRIWRERAQRQLAFLGGRIQRFPSAHTWALTAMLWEVYPAQELVCVLTGEEEIPNIYAYLRKRKIPNLSVIAITPDNRKKLENLLLDADGYRLSENKNTYYLCNEFGCQKPVTKLSELQILGE